MYVGNNLVRTKIYVSALFEKEIRNNDTTQIHYITGPEGVIAVYSKNNNGLASFIYKHRDHLNSVVMISNDTGAIVARYSYDAWGKRRNSDWSSSLTDSASLANERGFTGHEHYDLFELIDMNGRVYDPVLARFLSPDPFIQDPTNLQSLNRYAYVVNNPLTLVDPSGHFFGFFKSIGKFISNWGGPFKLIGGVMMDIAAAAEHVANVSGQWLKENWKTIVVAAVAITVGVLTAGVGAGVLGVIISGAASGFASGVTATLLNGGNIGDALIAGAKGAAIGAITSAATFGVGSLAEAAGKSMGSAGYYGVKAIGHGVVQGASNVAQGGKFSHGFFSGAVSGAVAPWINNQLDSRIAKVAVSAIVGGTTSAICGGKFANGAVTGAFVMMYNDFMHERAAELKEKIENMTSEQTERLSTHDKLLVNAAHEYATQMENSHGFIQESVTELKFLGKKFLIDLLVPNQNHSIPSNIEDPSLKGDVYNIDKNINSIFQH
jgi:RHS repeat-associated protein